MTTARAGSADLERTLAAPGVHRTWEATYRTAENERFFEEAFDEVVHLVGAPEGATFLDAGCGVGSHSLRLAARGFRVVAVDFSESALAVARDNVTARGFADRVRLERADLLRLPFADGAFERVLCWGVLMHVPDVERALDELARVLRPGGTLVLSEGNAASWHARLLDVLNALRRRKPDLRHAPAGKEYQVVTDTGVLLVRHAHVAWLVDQLRRRGFSVRHHRAGQFTELYARAPWPWLSSWIHGWNAFWFRHVRSPGPAFGNILILTKNGQRESRAVGGTSSAPGSVLNSR